MKRIVLSAFVLLFCVVVKAQPPARPYDTIVGREVTYLYIPEWMEETDSNLPSDFHCSCIYQWIGSGIQEIAIRYETDSVLPIIGIAVCCSSAGGIFTRPDSLNWDTNLANWFETLSLYKHTPDGQMTVLAQNTFNILNITRWIKNCQEFTIEFTDNYYYPVYEVFFDKPVQVTDSFYVGLTLHNNIPEGGLYPNRPTLIVSHDSRPAIVNNRNAFYYPSLGGWIFYNNRQVYDSRCYFLFPIFDTTGMGLSPHCDPVTNLHQGSTWSNCTMLLWDSISGQIAWQLAVGRADQDPEDYYIYNNLPSPSKTLYNLEYNTLYAARVRAKCEGNRNYSPWSDTIQFSITREQGIDTANAPALFSLYPNPASDRIEVFSSFALLRLEVYDLNGRRMLAQDCQGHSATIDASSWPEGTYIAIVRTPAGASSQKLTIKR